MTRVSRRRSSEQGRVADVAGAGTWQPSIMESCIGS